MFQLTLLPEALFPVILDFLERIDATQTFSICRRYYELCKRFRQCSVRFQISSAAFIARVERIQSFISYPINQLVCNIPNAFPSHLDHEVFPFTEMKRLTCSLSHFWFLVHQIPGLKISCLDLQLDDEYKHETTDTELQMKVLNYLLEHHQRLEITEFTFQGKTTMNPVMIPFLQSLKALTVRLIGHKTSNIFIPSEYFSRLRTLQLIGEWNVTDLSLLNNIYDLEISNCHGLHDISPLQRNHRITISSCPNVKDFSYCFAESISITIIATPPFQLLFDFGYWQKVQRLWLGDYAVFGSSGKEQTISFKENHLILPSSVRFLELRGSFVQALYRPNIPLPLQLREFIIVSSNELTQLPEGTGIERVPVVMISTCGKLSSIQGIGEKNHHVTMFNCPKVLDITPLRKVSFVSVDGSDMMLNLRDLSVLTEVKHIIFRVVDFPLHFPFHCLQGLDTLDIRFCRILSEFVERLAQIRILQINSGHLTAWFNYQKAGGKMWNEKIEVMVHTPFNSFSFNKERFYQYMQQQYEEFLAKDYHYSIVYRPGNEYCVFIRNT